MLMASSNSFQPSSLVNGQDEKSNDAPCIKNVWVDNFEEELPIISDLLEKYPYIAMVR